MWQVIERTGVVQILKKSLEQGQLPNAYLLVGPAHIGKMTAALDLARALNCETKQPCEQCLSCQKIVAGKHADVQVIGLNGDNSRESKTREISIGQIRDMQHDSYLPPFEGKYKVFIIDGAEQLSNEAANCLLKTLEEPAENVIYILLTINDKLLPSTVVSRCQRLDLLPLPASDIENLLHEKLNIDPERAKLVSQLARGCPGWAISAAQDEGVLDQRKEKIERIIELSESGIEQRFDYVSQLVSPSYLESGRAAIQNELELWLEWWHDMILVRSNNADRIMNIDYAATLERAAVKFDLMQIRRFIGRIQEAEIQLKLNASPRLVLEVLMLNIPGRSK